MKAGPDLHSFSEPLAWQVDVTNTGDALLVAGTVEGEATTSCARCLDEFSFPVTGEIEGYYPDRRPKPRRPRTWTPTSSTCCPTTTRSTSSR